MVVTARGMEVALGVDGERDLSLLAVGPAEDPLQDLFGPDLGANPADDATLVPDRRLDLLAKEQPAVLASLLHQSDPLFLLRPASLDLRHLLLHLLRMDED